MAGAGKHKDIEILPPSQRGDAAGGSNVEQTARDDKLQDDEKKGLSSNEKAALAAGAGLGAGGLGGAALAHHQANVRYLM
jgi:hypothetical protein